jgi:hypothetical protein
MRVYFQENRQHIPEYPQICLQFSGHHIKIQDVTGL